MSDGLLYRYEKWGPAVWTHMHVYSFTYPGKANSRDRERAREFISLVPFTLPCGNCGHHFAVAITEKRPLTDAVLAGREPFSRWLVDLHNDVNRRLGKPQMTYREAVALYVTHGDGAGATASSTWKVVAIVMIVLAVALAIALTVVLVR